MLALAEVDAFYGRSHILHQVSWTVQRGQLATVLDATASAKPAC